MIRTSAKVQKMVQEIIPTLAKGQYIMILNHGMLGVNLKQTYLEGGGVYVDFMVPGGNAAKSGVIRIGDALCRVGKTSVKKGSIRDVPGIIANHSRPAPLILNMEHDSLVWNCMDFVDVAVGMILYWRERGKRGISSLPISSSSSSSPSSSSKKTSSTQRPPHPLDLRNSPSLLDDVVPPAGEEKEEKDDEHGSIIASTTHTSSFRLPPKNLRQLTQSFAIMRNNERISMSSITSAYQQDAQFRDILLHAFVSCCTDSRRLPFLAAHLSNEDAFDTGSGSTNATTTATTGNTDPNSTFANGSTQLMLYLELLSFRDLFGVTPVSRRCDYARRIATKYLSPDAAFDLRSMFSSEELDNLDNQLRVLPSSSNEDSGKEQDNDDNHNDAAVVLTIDIFSSVETLLERSLAGVRFASFLISDECARMRAYMRKTFPYVDCSLKDVFDRVSKVGWDANLPLLLTSSTSLSTATTASNSHSIIGEEYDLIAKNHMAYIMLFLLCQEADISNKNFDKGVGKASSSGKADGGKSGGDVLSKRLMGSAGGISCAIFVKRIVFPLMEGAKQLLPRWKEDGEREESLALCRNLISSFEQLWDAFLSPAGGMLNSMLLSNETQGVLDDVRRKTVTAALVPDDDSLSPAQKGLHIVRALSNDAGLKPCLEKLMDELLYDYAVNVHPKYRAHKFHEWMCGEVNKAINVKEDSGDEDEEDDGKKSADYEMNVLIPPLTDGCISRLMKKVELPRGVSRHRPIRSDPDDMETDRDDEEESEDNDDDSDDDFYGNLNADCAVVFGTDNGSDHTGRLPHLSQAHEEELEASAIRRFSSVALAFDEDGDEYGDSLSEVDIPRTLESYAFVPSRHKHPFSKIMDESRQSQDGWETSLVDFVIPSGSGVDGSLKDSLVYGVSLVLTYNGKMSGEPSTKERDGFRINIVSSSKDTEESKTTNNDTNDEFKSPLSLLSNENDDNSHGGPSIVVRASSDSPEYNQCSQESSWSNRVTNMNQKDSKGKASIGIALVSAKNVIPAMRKSLTKLYYDVCTIVSSSLCNESKNDDSIQMTGVKYFCAPLVDMLGNFCNHGVETKALSSILDRYLQYGSMSYIEMPISYQREIYEIEAGKALIESLPPIPLALLFVTALLEQKIVFSSSRRSLLLSISLALRKLLNPFRWSHLFVPLVPEELAQDLVQYPAPFILGISSGSRGSMDLLNSLPDEVTLVDLDVGRVILAKSFSHNFEVFKVKSDEKETVTALRSQVLYLAEALGGYLASQQADQTWLCDSPISNITRDILPNRLGGDGEVETGCASKEDFLAVSKTCKEFIYELISGANTCCFWIEEEILSDVNTPFPQDISKSDLQCDVLFDEDRYFHLKNLRAQGLYKPLFDEKHYFAENNPKNKSEAEDTFALENNAELAISPDNFDLVLEMFLRGQGFSLFISSWKKEAMTFW